MPCISLYTWQEDNIEEEEEEEEEETSSEKDEL